MNTYGQRQVGQVGSTNPRVVLSTDQRVEALEKQVRDLTERLEQAEMAIKAIPNQEDISPMHPVP
jgi:hypothetical protein